ncbi:PTS system mannose/fructose/sorbose family transporter subunit IID [Traorella massiliensis]|uniref:PTS system mannose/fructose/sorbose family transporter subunit IID n=1 Tax=Traorella massiliensis TaxID=1903263 RepID=UPI002354F60B|nr:PTS system mannose/fructose/sorbose family transporter subunit IID [Traorella massiliensis]
MSKQEMTKELLKKVYIRGLTFQLSWSYERMQGIGFLNSITPVLEEVYKDDPEGLKKALMRHTHFFNTSTIWGAYPILGMATALELGKADGDTIEGIKTSLMGPMAGIGDTMNFSIILPIFFSIPASMAIGGNTMSAIAVLAIIDLLLIIGLSIVKWKLMNIGFSQGSKLTQSMEMMDKLSFGAGVLGLVVVGGMVASMLSISTPISFLLDYQGVPIQMITSAVPEDAAGAVVLQNVLNSFMPKLLPVVLMAIVYWMYQKKKITPIKITFILMIAMFILGAFGIIARG